MMIQYSNYAGRVTGAVLGGAGVQMGMKWYVGVQMGVVGVALRVLEAAQGQDGVKL
ncbi:hypothetical protein C8F01DRAFT_1136863 [Mycena amicta]|nr:hypothetical protein C8F01DRAFT_1136863 [Mycena amicta]